MEGYRLPFSSTSWHNDSNGQRFLFFFLNLFLPCQPSSGITVIQVPSNQKKLIRRARSLPRPSPHRWILHNYVSCASFVLHTSPAFRKGHSIAAKLGWLDQKSESLQPSTNPKHVWMFWSFWKDDSRVTCFEKRFTMTFHALSHWNRLEQI